MVWDLWRNSGCAAETFRLCCSVCIGEGIVVMRKNDKPIGARIGEAGFCILYLVTLIIFLFIIRGKWAAADNDSLYNPEFVRYRFAFLLTLLLLIGDSFHLIPRIIENLKGRTERLAFPLGLGNIISSVTMTIFYNVLMKAGDGMEYHHEAYNLWVEQTILWLTMIRIALLLFPQNAWFSPVGNRKWAVIRNVPFVLIGILTIIGYFGVIGNASNYPVSIFVQVIVAVALSFLTYLPVAIYGREKPKLGMLMIPKTMCYVWILAVLTFG